MRQIQSSLKAFEIMKHHFNSHSEEVWVIALDSQLKLISKELIFKGTVDRCPIHPRDIFRFLISKNATAYILVHNHPSNSIKPSKEDIKITKKFIKISDLLEIKMMDHIILCSQNYYSFADHGYLQTTMHATAQSHP